MSPRRLTGVLNRLATNARNDDTARELVELAAHMAMTTSHPRLRRAAALVAKALDVPSSPAEPTAHQLPPNRGTNPSSTFPTGGVAAAETAPPAAASGVLHGLADTLNCGEYGFSRYNTQLLVFRLGTQRREGGEYDVSRLPRHRWAGLVGRDHVPLNAIVFRDDDAIRILAGDVPAQPHMLDSLR